MDGTDPVPTGVVKAEPKPTPVRVEPTRPPEEPASREVLAPQPENPTDVAPERVATQLESETTNPPKALEDLGAGKVVERTKEQKLQEEAKLSEEYRGRLKRSGIYEEKGFAEAFAAVKKEEGFNDDNDISPNALGVLQEKAAEKLIKANDSLRKKYHIDLRNEPVRAHEELEKLRLERLHKLGSRFMDEIDKSNTLLSDPRFITMLNNRKSAYGFSGKADAEIDAASMERIKVEAVSDFLEKYPKEQENFKKLTDKLAINKDIPLPQRIQVSINEAIAELKTKHGQENPQKVLAELMGTIGLELKKFGHDNQTNFGIILIVLALMQPFLPTAPALIFPVLLSKLPEALWDKTKQAGTKAVSGVASRFAGKAKPSVPTHPDTAPEPEVPAPVPVLPAAPPVMTVESSSSDAPEEPVQEPAPVADSVPVANQIGPQGNPGNRLESQERSEQAQREASRRVTEVPVQNTDGTTGNTPQGTPTA